MFWPRKGKRTDRENQEKKGKSRDKDKKSCEGQEVPQSPKPRKIQSSEKVTKK